MRNPSRPNVRILVVDDYEPFRRFLHLQLQPRTEWQIISEASDGLEAIHKAKEHQPDLILLDIELPSLNGIAAAHQISKVAPAATILFLSQNNDAAVIAAALSNGAKGYVLKQDATELLAAIESVMRGEHFMSTGVAERRSNNFPDLDDSVSC